MVFNLAAAQVYDLKLSAMRTMVRTAALVLTVVTTGFVLQVGDSAATTVRSVASRVTPVAILVPGMTHSFDHEYFISRLQVVPVGRRNITLPILMYHYIRTPPPKRTDMLGYKLSVSPGDFALQMDWLSTHAFHPVDFNDVRAYFAGKEPLPASPVVITLDDGYADLFTAAFPILRSHRFKAVSYIVSGFVGRPGYVTAAEIMQMDTNGIEIASHTVNHADLARNSAANTMRELVDSKRWLEHLLGHPVVDFAYPSGKFNAQAVAEVKQAGYETAVTTMASVDHSVADRFLWTRIRVGGGESLADFALSLGTPMTSATITVADIEPAGIDPPPLASPAPLLPK
jgi:peptidoglycan/xylan/chitin deacetylase (PgdA/CDA1 family)